MAQSFHLGAASSWSSPQQKIEQLQSVSLGAGAFAFVAVSDAGQDWDFAHVARWSTDSTAAEASFLGQHYFTGEAAVSSLRGGQIVVQWAADRREVSSGGPQSSYQPVYSISVIDEIGQQPPPRFTSQLLTGGSDGLEVLTDGSIWAAGVTELISYGSTGTAAQGQIFKLDRELNNPSAFSLPHAEDFNVKMVALDGGNVGLAYTHDLTPGKADSVFRVETAVFSAQGKLLGTPQSVSGSGTFLRDIFDLGASGHAVLTGGYSANQHLFVFDPNGLKAFDVALPGTYQNTSAPEAAVLGLTAKNIGIVSIAANRDALILTILDASGKAIVSGKEILSQLPDTLLDFKVVGLSDGDFVVAGSYLVPGGSASGARSNVVMARFDALGNVLGETELVATVSGRSILGGLHYDGADLGISFSAGDAVELRQYAVSGRSFVFKEGQASQAATGSADFDTVSFLNDRADYSIRLGQDGIPVLQDSRGGAIRLIEIDRLLFSDSSYNLEIGNKVASVAGGALESLIDLYVAYFNRVPEASGLSYWIDQFAAGKSMTAIAAEFYAAGIQFSETTGYTADMPLSDFIKVLYANVLGRSGDTAPPDADIDYWLVQVATGAVTREGMVARFLNDARLFYDDPNVGWVPRLLDQKVEFGKLHAVTYGLDYNDQRTSIETTVALAAAVTPTGYAEAVAMVGLSADDYLV